MKKLTIKSLVIFAIVFSMIGVDSVSAAKAFTGSGTGCYIRFDVGEDDYVLDENCTAHSTLKLDDEGNFQFYVYQDHGQLPEGSWRPSRTYRSSFELCFAASFGSFCGIAKETITPSGEYKSSFNSY